MRIVPAIAPRDRRAGDGHVRISDSRYAFSTSHSFNGERDLFKHNQRFDAGFTRRCFSSRGKRGDFIEPPDAASMRNPLAIEIVLRVGEPLASPWRRQNIRAHVVKTRYRTEGGGGVPVATDTR